MPLTDGRYFEPVLNSTKIAPLVPATGSPEGRMLIVLELCEVVHVSSIENRSPL